MIFTLCIVAYGTFKVNVLENAERYLFTSTCIILKKTARFICIIFSSVKQKCIYFAACVIYTDMVIKI